MNRKPVRYKVFGVRFPPRSRKTSSHTDPGPVFAVCLLMFCGQPDVREVLDSLSACCLCSHQAAVDVWGGLKWTVWCYDQTAATFSCCCVGERFRSVPSLFPRICLLSKRHVCCFVAVSVSFVFLFPDCVFILNAYWTVHFLLFLLRVDGNVQEKVHAAEFLNVFFTKDWIIFYLLPCSWLFSCISFELSLISVELFLIGMSRFLLLVSKSDVFHSVLRWLIIKMKQMPD